MSPKCKTCGAPVSLVPDGDLHYKPDNSDKIENQKLKKQIKELQEKIRILMKF